MKRYPLLDLYRFSAIVLMVFFHFFFDLSTFDQVEIDFKHHPFWFGLPRLIVFIFYTAAGVSLRLVHFPRLNQSSFQKRSLQLLVSSLVITVVTYLIYPKNFIYYGTLHGLLVGTFAALPLLKFPRIAGLLGATFLLTNFIFRPEFFALGQYLGNIESIDYIPFYPWVGAIWIGIWMHAQNLHQLTPTLSYGGEKFVRWCSRHALAIYLLHQPLLFGLCLLIFRLIPSWTK